MRRLWIPAVALCFLGPGCGKEEPTPAGIAPQPVVAEAPLPAVAEPAARESPPEPYARVTITEKPVGRILYNSHRGSVVHAHELTLGEDGPTGEPQSRWLYQNPRWSPDGAWVLLSYHGGTTNRFELGKTPAAGGELTALASSAEHDSIHGAWSPDGRRLAYVQRKDNAGEIALLDLDHGAVRILAAHDQDDFNPAWSADGKTLAFTSYRGGESAIYCVASEGGGAVRRLSPGGDRADQAAFSPDGRYLAYVATDRHAETGAWVRDLKVMRLDGGATRALAVAQKQILGLCWSPGSQWIAFGQDDGAGKDLLLIDVNGENLRPLTHDPHTDSNPSWGPPP